MDYWDLNPLVLRNEVSRSTRSLARSGMIGCVLDQVSLYDWRTVRNWCDANSGTVLSRRKAESADGLASWSAYIWFTSPSDKDAFIAFLCSLPGRLFVVNLAHAEDEGARRAARAAERRGENVWLRDRWDGTCLVEFGDMLQAMAFTDCWGGRVSTVEADCNLQSANTIVGGAIPHSAIDKFLTFHMPEIFVRVTMAA